MPDHPNKIVLGSRSPRRFELLRHFVPAERIEMIPPQTADEPGFDDLHAWPEIARRLLEIARQKCRDVIARIRESGADRPAVVITADTVIVGLEDDGRLVVLGQPPDDESWPDVVRRWFHRYYFGKTHTAATGFCLLPRAGRRIERIVKSSVTFCQPDERLLERYIATGEPRGKAGGYALQGMGGVFVTRVEGSLSNVVGLPLRELIEAFDELGISV